MNNNTKAKRLLALKQIGRLRREEKVRNAQIKMQQQGESSKLCRQGRY